MLLVCYYNINLANECNINILCEYHAHAKGGIS